MDCTGKVSQVFDDNPQGIRLKGRPKTDRGPVYKQILINANQEMANEVKNGADWEKYIKKAKVSIGLQCHLQKRRRRTRRGRG
jgi:hypothetical protein